METALAFAVLIIAYCIHRLLKRDQPDEKITNAGIWFTLKQIVAYIHLKYLQLRKENSQNIYEGSLEDPAVLGIVSHKRDWDFELPHELDERSKHTDEISFHGVNSKGQCLVLYFTRRPDNIAEIWLYIKLSDESCYSLPKLPTIANYVGTDNSFIANGLKIQCLSPMRRWRISFNGLLKKVPTVNSVVTSHVKFKFIWSAMSPLYNRFDDSSLHLISSAIAGEKWASNLPDAERLKLLLGGYEQCGYTMGTVEVDNEENEMYLWGIRSRNYATLRMEPSYYNLHVVGVGKTGNIISVGALSVPGIITDFQYGFISSGDGLVCPIDSSNISLSQLYVDGHPPSVKMVEVNSGNKMFKLQIDNIEAKTIIGTTFFSELHLSSASLNKSSAQSICIFYHKLRPETIKEKCIPCSIPNFKDIKENGNHFVASLSDCSYDSIEIIGGKALSLVKLNLISEKERQFYVPKGIVVTFNAYKELISNQNLLKQISVLENIAWSRETNGLKEECKKTVKLVEESSLPELVQIAVLDKLAEVFGNDYNNISFAIRSSAAGEDSEELSCAGQMETFLNISGINSIFENIMKCWASQFSYLAIEYKRRNGQQLNTPMAVIIQEMVKAASAGVMFTCDPVTSNPNNITITANYGLGESVVSDSSESDTILLWRDHVNQLSLHSFKIGSKKTKIIANESGGTAEVLNVETEQLCISENQALQLGKIGLMVEEYFGSLRDIEWAIKSEEFYLLQTRPITSVDNITDFEIRHELDGPWKSETEYTTKANVGLYVKTDLMNLLVYFNFLYCKNICITELMNLEVFPGATSPLGFSTIVKIFDLHGQRMMKKRQKNYILCPYFTRAMVATFGHVVFNLVDTLYRFNAKKSSLLSKSSIVSLLGRVIENDSEFVQRGLERYSSEESIFNILRIVYLFYDIYSSKTLLQKTTTKYASYRIPFENFNTATELYEEMGHQMLHLLEVALSHMCCTMSSSIWNAAVLSNLAKARNGWTTEVFTDFALLTSNIDCIESADVPSTIDELGKNILGHIDKNEFQKLDTKDAFLWLKNTPAINDKFEEFLQKHGHRCIKEFDVFSKTWRMDPLPVIKTIQNSIGKPHREKGKEIDTELLLNKIKSPLTSGQKRILRFVLPRCRKAVALREASKSLLIKTLDSFRQAYHHMSQLMVKEGRLVNEDDFFFFTFEELGLYLKTLSPRLLMKAKSRHRIFSELDEMKFPEIMQGIPKPHQSKKFSITTESQTSITLKGTPVSQGIIKGKVRVVHHMTDADSICQGEILITYSTDIGWSPYFPLLSGLITEIGGLISHGAVVAREYGLPCLVGVHSATELFQSGDVVLLDANNGFVQKLSE